MAGSLNKVKRSDLGKLIAWMLGIVSLGAVLTGVFAYEEMQGNHRVVKQNLDAVSAEIERDLMARLRLYENRLRGLRGAIHMVGVDALNRTLITRYSKARNVQQEYPGSRGFGFIRRISPAQVPAFEAFARADGRPDFQIHQMQAHDGDLYVVQYVDPPGVNDQALGFDLASEGRRKAAAVRALQTGEATLSAPISLLNDPSGSPRSFLLLLPIYRILGTPSTLAEREQDAVGWTYAPLVMSEVMTFMDLSDRKLHFAIFDATDAASVEPLYETTDAYSDPQHLSTHIFEREVYGRLWRFEVSAYPELVESLEPVRPRNIFLGGGLLSLLLAVLVASQLLSRQRQQEISAGQARLATIVENSSDAIIGEGLDGSIITWNPAAEQMFGYSEAEVLGKPLAPLLVPQDLFWEDEELLARVARGERGPTLETRRQHKDGRLIDVTITCSFIRENNGFILGAAKLMHDISDRKRAEAYLKEFNAALEQQVNERTAELSRLAGLFQTVLDAASEVAIIATNKNGQVNVFNRGAERLLGYSTADVLLSKSPDEFHVRGEIEQRCHELEQELGRKVLPGEVFYIKPDMGFAEHRQWTYVRKDGSHVPVSLVVTAIRTSEGELIGHLGIAEDITERLRTSEELQAAKLAAETANAAKSLFLANMSHEIRTPMNAVIGVANLLQNTPLNEYQRGLLGKLQIAGKSLLGIINDILDIAKIESGEMRLEQAPFSPRQLLFELKELFTPQAEIKGLQFNVEGAAQLPDMVQGDALRVNQILINLVGNALKFTATGSVTVIADYVIQDQSVDLIFRVRDTGCGIEEHALRNLFTPFTQADASTTRRFGGTGLGLSVVRGLAEQMGGRVDVTSVPHQGSEFCVHLPLPLLDHDFPLDMAHPRLEVFIVAGLELGATLSRFCESFGWGTQLFHSTDALLLYLSSQSKKDAPSPDLLITEAVPLLNKTGGLFDDQHQILTLLKSSVTQIFIAGEQRFAGYIAPELQKHVLYQPVDPCGLFNLVSTLFFEALGSTHRVMTGTIVDSSTAQWLAGLKLLLVDDSDLNLELAGLLLEQQGAGVQKCCNGREAVSTLQEQGAVFDAVLMDIQMPEMDGYEATRIIRQEMGMLRLPIVALTAGALAEEKKRAQAAGMTDFLTKPLDLVALICVVRRVVEFERKSVLPVVGCHQSFMQPQGLPHIEGFSIEEAVARFSYDLGLFWSSVSRLLVEFAYLSDTPATYQAAVDSPADAAARFHKLRGSAKLVGADELASLAERLEMAFRAGFVGTEQQQLLLRVATVLEQLKRSAQPHLATTTGEPESQSAPTTARVAIVAAQQELHRLCVLLARRDMAAIEEFTALVPLLDAVVSQSVRQDIWNAIDNLRFDEAIRCLRNAGLIAEATD